MQYRHHHHLVLTFFSSFYYHIFAISFVNFDLALNGVDLRISFIQENDDGTVIF